MKTLALFDFDGTLYQGDSMLDFIRHTHGERFLKKRLTALAPLIVLGKLGILDIGKAKARLLKSAYGGSSVADLTEQIESFTALIEDRLFPKAAEVLKHHLHDGDRVVIVSASCELWLGPWCIENGIELICTPLSIVDGTISGELDGPNCRGPEKVVRIKKAVPLNEYDQIFAYGNDRGDREMLSLANQPIIKIHY